MAKCPNCGRHLTIFNVSQFCPQCKVNMRFFNFEENFLREAKYAELSQAVVHCKIKNLKAAFIGSPLTIARLCVMLLPLLCLLLPAAKIGINLPFKPVNEPLSALGVYSMFSSGAVNLIMQLQRSSVYWQEFSSLYNAMFGFAAVAVFAVAVLLTSILCFLSCKNMQKITCAVSAAGILSCLCSYVLIIKAAKVAGAAGIVGFEKSFGIFIVAIAFAVVFAVNFVLAKKGIKVEYDEGMQDRSAIYKKVKSGEVNLDSLPQPVVETEETRKIDEEIALEHEKLRTALEKKAAENEETGENADA